MCLIAAAAGAHPAMPLVVAANRDEFHARPAAPAGFWPGHPRVFGGRDQSAGGSWLAVAPPARLACVTNVRRMLPPDPRARSRGWLVRDFVSGGATAADFAAELAGRAGEYSGFNLLLYDGHELRFVTNSESFRTETVAPGVHVVSNATLDTPWPKARRLRAALERWVGTDGAAPEPLLEALADRATAPDAELPDTGVGLDLERMLSAPFIVGPRYGTRCSTVVLVTSAGTVRFIERRFDAAGRLTGETRRVIDVARTP